MTSGTDGTAGGSAGGTVAARPTSRDVARAAGVSQAAVSLVMGDKWRGRVAETTAERVRAAAQQLGYRPNLAARNLRLGRTRTALLVVPALTNEFFAGVYTGAARIAARHDFGVVLYPSPDGIGPARDPFPNARAALDGILASSMAADAVATLRGDGSSPMPLVMLDSDPAGSRGATTVNLDLVDGTRQITDHLLAHGHRHFLHLASAVDSWTFDVRAHELAARTDRLPGTTVRTVRSALTVEDALAATERALRTSGLVLPTAVVCDDDKLAAGAYKAARRLGLRVPDHLSVTGFDDLSLATAIEPELTTVRLPAEEFGERGMSALLAVLDGRTPDTTPLPVELIVRGSTGPAPAAP
ncbi:MULTISPECIES: LacI family DNA-binding transcriptional regulator [unclassified Streptomyces]|uniref:LacI family DNA-binding transcriptional regulator n=1 Tax=unclassified Streptomyces TaxID=2593676 RepID=UPI0003738D04|nr:LacI family DNA-binding transcriptional regulator [Streptomyces sp. HmicA12]